jgi:sulfoxide reductase heme-binding subunit YedZ
MRPQTVLFVKIALLVVLLAPLGQLGFQVFQTVQGQGDGLGVNPIERLTHRTGELALYCLLLSLAVTPLRLLTGRAVLTRFRRLIGLVSFAYAVLHLGIYVLDRSLGEDGFTLRDVGKDIVKRPYITIGTLAFLILLSLAVTSTNGMIRRLGHSWQKLHRLVYPAAVLVIIHFAWLVKAGLTRPLIFFGVLMGLLAARIPSWVRPPQAKGRKAAARANASE